MKKKKTEKLNENDRSYNIVDSFDLLCFQFFFLIKYAHEKNWETTTPKKHAITNPSKPIM